jgi:hypothetical protein
METRYSSVFRELIVKYVIFMKSSDNLITRMNKCCHELKVPYPTFNPLMKSNRYSEEVREFHEAPNLLSLWLILRRC